VIRGLNDRYTALGLHLCHARPFPPSMTCARTCSWRSST
jgi:hypothetical protein